MAEREPIQLGDFQYACPDCNHQFPRSTRDTARRILNDRHSCEKINLIRARQEARR
jgi:hypothetical protein